MRQHDCGRVASLQMCSDPQAPDLQAERTPARCAAPPLLAALTTCSGPSWTQKTEACLQVPSSTLPCPDISAAPSSPPELLALPSRLRLAVHARVWVNLDQQEGQGLGAPSWGDWGWEGGVSLSRGWAGGRGSGVPRGRGQPQ